VLHAWVYAPSLSTRGGPPDAPYSAQEHGRHSVASPPPGAVGGETLDRTPVLRRLPAAYWLAGASASVSRLHSYRSTRPAREGRGPPTAASRRSPRVPRCLARWQATLSPRLMSSAWSRSPAAVGGRSRRGHRPQDDSPLLVGAKGLFLPDELLPGLQQLRRLPCAIRQRRPGTPDSLLG
jgi:hypothetical protein